MSTLIANKIPEFNHERLLSKITATDGCWHFNGCITSSGYGQYSLGKTRYYVHRLIWSIFNGDLNPLMVIDHKCRNRACCNPDHLREVSRKTNMIENSASASGLNHIKEQCINGHMFDEKNTYIYSKGRGCKICRRETNKRLRRK